MDKGELRAGPLITEVMPLEDWRGAFELVASKQAVKIVLDPVEKENSDG